MKQNTSEIRLAENVVARISIVCAWGVVAGGAGRGRLGAQLAARGRHYTGAGPAGPLQHRSPKQACLRPPLRQAALGRRHPTQQRAG